MSTLFSLYIRDAGLGGDNIDAGWLGRQGIALALQSSADVLRTKDLPVVVTFLISRALADANADVRGHMINAGIVVIDKHGKNNVYLLFPIFENYLNKAQASDEEKYDLVREGVVIFTGSLAKHLAEDDTKVQAVVEKLLDMLNTPSEDVQRAVSSCLSPLMKSKQEDATALVSRLLDKMMKSEKYGERRGAAFGLSGVVKGLGIRSLKNCGIATVIREGLADRNSAKSREGALLAFECLCEKLGRLFEPYVIQMLPLLLVGLSDPVMAVRDAAECAARAMMSHLSAQGVKLVLPSPSKHNEFRISNLQDTFECTERCTSSLSWIQFIFVNLLWQAKPSAISAHTSTFGPVLTECLKDGIPPVRLAAERCDLHTFQLTNGTKNVQAAHRTVRSSFTSIACIGTKDVIYIRTEGRSCIDSAIVRVGTNIKTEDDSKLYPIIDGGMIGGSGPTKTTEILVKAMKFSDSKSEQKFLNGMTQFHTSMFKERSSKGVCDPV